MLPYWLLYSIYAIGAFQSERRDPNVQSHNVLLIAAATFTALLIGLRYQVGGDWSGYIRHFEVARYADFVDVFAMKDPGYAFINWMAHQIGADIWAVNLFCGVVFTWGLIKFARFHRNPWLVVLVSVPYLIIVVGMGYTRQAVAIGIVLAGLANFDRRSIVSITVYVIAAALFHKSAIVVLPIAALTTVKNRAATAVLVCLLTVALYWLFVESQIEEIYEGYVEAAYEAEGAIIRVAMNILPAAVFILAQHRFDVSKKERKLWRNFSLFAFFLAILLVFLPSSALVDRVALYLFPMQIFVLASLPYAFPLNGRPNGQVVLGLVFYSALIQVVWLTQATHARFWIPYQVYPFT